MQLQAFIVIKHFLKPKDINGYHIIDKTDNCNNYLNKLRNQNDKFCRIGSQELPSNQPD